MYLPTKLNTIARNGISDEEILLFHDVSVFFYEALVGTSWKTRAS